MTVVRRDSKELKDYPWLLGFNVGANTAVWCPYCKKLHYHGAMSEGHKVAHCFDGPFKERGYVVKLAPKAIIKELLQ